MFSSVALAALAALAVTSAQTVAGERAKVYPRAGVGVRTMSTYHGHVPPRFFLPPKLPIFAMSPFWRAQSNGRPSRPSCLRSTRSSQCSSLAATSARLVPRCRPPIKTFTCGSPARVTCGKKPFHVLVEHTLLPVGWGWLVVCM